MPDFDEQRKKVEELKKKILEQRKKGSASPLEPVTESTVQELLTPEEPPAAPVPAVEKKKEMPPGGELQTKIKPEISSVQEEQKKIPAESAAGDPARSTMVASLKAYAQVLRQAWADGSISKDEEEMLRTLRTSLSVSESEHESLQHEVQTEIYQNLMTRIWKQGSMSPQDSEKLDFIREKFNISAEEHMKIEKNARQILLQKK